MNHERPGAGGTETVPSIVSDSLSETALAALARRNHRRRNLRNPLLADHTPLEDLEADDYNGFVIISLPEKRKSAWRPHPAALERLDDDLLSHDGMTSMEDSSQIYIQFLVKDYSEDSLDLVWHFGRYAVDLLGLRGQCGWSFGVMPVEEEPPQPAARPKLKLIDPRPEY